MFNIADAEAVAGVIGDANEAEFELSRADASAKDTLNVEGFSEALRRLEPDCKEHSY